MPSSKKKNNNKKNNNKLLKGGKSCPSGSHKVCITTGQLDKLLKQVAVKKRTKKLRKANPNKRKKQGTAKVVPEKNKSFLGSMFGSDEETLPKVEPKVVEEQAKPVEEKSIEEKSIEETMIEDKVEPPITESKDEVVTQKPKKEEQKSFLGSIFGTEEKKPAAPAQ
jgi:hypothetical protein